MHGALLSVQQHEEQLKQSMAMEQDPKLLVLLAGQQASSAAGSGGTGGTWILLSPDTMHQHRLCSQQLCLVGLCSVGEAAAAAPATPKASRPAMGSPAPASLASPSPSRFGPAHTPALNASEVQLVDLAQRAGVCRDDTGVAAGGSEALSAAAEGGAEQQPGKFLLPVTVWPCARLARGSALLSPGAWDSLAQPPPGTYLAVYEPLAAAAPATAATLQLQLCTDSQQLPLTPRHIAASPAADGSTSFRPGGSTASTPSKAASATAATGSTTPSKTPASSKKSSSKKGGSSKAGQQQQQQYSSSSSNKRTDLTAQWQLRLLQNGIDWSNVKHRQLLQQLAHRQLLGRPVLPGNITYVPVLGLQLLFQLHPQPAAAAAAQQQQPTQPLLVSTSTQIQLVMPGQQLAEDPSSSSSTTQSDATAAVAAAAGLPAGKSSIGSTVAVQRDLASCIAAARSAAQDSVVGSSQEAAMEAAERAVRAGAAAVAAGSGYSRLGGISSYSAALKELVLLPLQLPELFAKYKLRPPRGLLLHGPPGSGKTALARAAAVEAGATLLVVNGPDVLTEFYGESEAGLTGIFAAAAALSPAIIFIDELDAIAPSRESQGHGGASAHSAAAGGGSGGSAAGEAAARVLTQLLTLMDGLSNSSSSIAVKPDSQAGSSTAMRPDSQAVSSSSSSSTPRFVVIAATNRPAVLDPALRRPGRFERELEVGVPDPAAREDILRVRLSTVKHCLTPEQVHQLAATTHGYVGADLAALVNEAAMGALRRHIHLKQRQHQQVPGADALPSQQQQPLQQQQQPHLLQQQQQPASLCVCWEDVAAARLLVKPSALREVAVEVPQVTWDDVGGLEAIKQRLQEAVLWPQQHADALTRLGATAPKGVLLYGPPGCSKTLLARAVAATAGLNFLSVKGGELYSKYVGESERAVAALFARARGAAPSIVFFDEIDGLAGHRGDAGGGGGIGERVLAQLLTELDGLQPSLGVVVLAATNRPDKVDPALLRPGRFDRLLLVPPPDEAARQEILKVHTRRTPLAPDVDLAQLAARTEGFTGADISALCREAAMSALEEDLGTAAVAARHFSLALLRVRPSSSPSSDVMAVYQQFQRHSGLAAA